MQTVVGTLQFTLYVPHSKARPVSMFRATAVTAMAGDTKTVQI